MSQDPFTSVEVCLNVKSLGHKKVRVPSFVIREYFPKMSMFGPISIQYILKPPLARETKVLSVGPGPPCPYMVNSFKNLHPEVYNMFQKVNSRLWKNHALLVRFPSK